MTRGLSTAKSAPAIALLTVALVACGDDGPTRTDTADPPARRPAAGTR